MATYSDHQQRCLDQDFDLALDRQALSRERLAKWYQQQQQKDKQQLEFKFMSELPKQIKSRSEKDQ